MQQFDNTIVLLVGMPGTGKYTIASELAKLTGARLIDNHLINNSLFTALGADGVTPLPSEVWGKITQIRTIVYDTIRELSPRHLSFIFTMHLVQDDEGDEKAFLNLEQLARDRQSLFVPVRLVCDVDELCRRVVNPDRAERLKEIDANSARRRATKHRVLEPRHPNVFTLDVTTKTAATSALEIFDKIQILSE